MTIAFLDGVRAHPVLHRATRSMPLIVSAELDSRGSRPSLWVSAVGEVDAENAKSFADQVCTLVRDQRGSVVPITLDLSGVHFFGVDGCTALHAVNAAVMRAGSDWSVVPSAAVDRVLQLCDPACLIPRSRLADLAEPA